MQNKEVEALKALLRQEVYEYFVGGDMPENGSDIDDDCLEVMLRIEGVLEYKESKSVIAEIEAAAVELAKPAIMAAAKDWISCELDDEILSALRGAKAIACKDGYKMSMKADIQASIGIVIDEWAENRRKEAQG